MLTSDLANDSLDGLADNTDGLPGQLSPPWRKGQRSLASLVKTDQLNLISQGLGFRAGLRV